MIRQIGLAVAGSLALAGWSVTPTFASSGPSPYTNGEFVRFQGQPHQQRGRGLDLAKYSGQLDSLLPF